MSKPPTIGNLPTADRLKPGVRIVRRIALGRFGALHGSGTGLRRTTQALKGGLMGVWQVVSRGGFLVQEDFAL
jgi:hypothetical protein